MMEQYSTPQGNVTTPLFLDLESMPTQRQRIADRIAEGVKPPGNMKKADTIAKWEQEQKPAAADEAVRKTSLDGTWGELACIGFALGNDGETTVIHREAPLDDPQTEVAMLDRFWRYLEKAHIHPWVGHNVLAFDLRFLWQRSMIRCVRPSVDIPVDVSPWDDRVFDTMHAWAGGRGSIKLSDLALGLLMEEPDDVDGSQVWDMIQEGRMDEVAEYCARDVDLVRRIYNHLRALQGL